MTALHQWATRALLPFLLLLGLHGAAQNTVTVMTWNLLNIYPSSTNRVPYSRTVTDSMLPDILAVQEVHGLEAARMFQTEVLQGRLALAPFTDGYDSDRALFYDSLKFAVAGAEAIGTNLRDINKVSLVHLPSGDTVHTYTVHLKAGASSTNRLNRNQEVMSLRQSTNALPAGSLFLLFGDVNMYQSSEPGYARLLLQDASGYFIDPIPVEGTWNNAAFAAYHTQSPRTRSFGGGAAGGLDDRFDFILFSQAILDGQRMGYVAESTWPVGNDGLHHNDSINHPPNALVSQQMADALHYASDHLPVVAQFVFYHTTSVYQLPNAQGLVRLYPNPTHGRCSVQLPDGRGYTVQVVDMLGKQVVALPNQQGTVQLNLAGLAAGVYGVVVHNAHLKATAKLVLE